MTNPMTELEETVERVRIQLFPALPSDFVQTIIQKETECMDNRSEAKRLVDAVIKAFLDAQDSENAQNTPHHG